MKSAMRRRGHLTRIVSSDFEQFTTELVMSMWNGLSHLPAMHKLKPRDYPEIYEAVLRSLKPYHEPLE
jgi:hypothetical protein